MASKALQPPVPSPPLLSTVQAGKRWPGADKRRRSSLLVLLVESHRSQAPGWSWPCPSHRALSHSLARPCPGIGLARARALPTATADANSLRHSRGITRPSRTGDAEALGLHLRFSPNTPRSLPSRCQSAFAAGAVHLETAVEPIIIIRESRSGLPFDWTRSLFPVHYCIVRGRLFVKVHHSSDSIVCRRARLHTGSRLFVRLPSRSRLPRNAKRRSYKTSLARESGRTEFQVPTNSAQPLFLVLHRQVGSPNGRKAVSKQ